MIGTNNYTQIKQLINGLNRWEIDKLIRELSSESISVSITSLYKTINNVRLENGRVCPHCQSRMIKKIGVINGNQRYLCHLCKKTYFATNKSIFNKTHKAKETWIKFIELMLSGVSIRKSATISGINKNTSLKWRHKIMSVLVKRLKHNKLTGNIELDDTFFKQSFKGEKGKSNKTLPKLRGISHNLICYTTGIDRANCVVSKFNGMGKNTIEKMQINMSDYFSKNSTIYSDEELAYREFAKLNNLNLFQINSKLVKEQNKLKHVNSLHSLLKQMMYRTRNVNSKHLDKYVQWVSWCKQSSKLSFAQQINAMFNDCCRTYV